MELTSDYQQTEIGPVPREWKISTLRETCSFENGDRGDNYPSKTSFRADGIPFVNAGQVAHGRVRTNDVDFISRESFDRLGGGKFRPGDILFCLRGSLGKFGVVPSDLGEGAIASSLVIVRPKSAAVSRDYIRCYFGSSVCSQMIEKWSGGAAQPNLGAQDLARFTIAIPPTRREQDAITEALGDGDALIESLEHLIAKKRQMKQGAMDELLTGDRRLPGFTEAWDRRRLGNVCQMKSGESITSRNIDEHSQFPCYGGNGLRGFAKRYTHDGRYALIGRQGALCGNVLIVAGRFFASEHAVVVTPHSDADVDWLSRILEKMNLNQYSESSAQPGLSVAKLLALECKVPPLPEQFAIATILSDMDCEIGALEAKLAKASEIKQGMMQELLTGRIRLI
jgi:type I restriction enzyme S subunit